MKELLIELQPALLSIALTLLTAFGSWLAVSLNAWIHAGKTNNEYVQIKHIINDTVDYVEQIAKRLDLTSEGKLELATKTATDWLNTKGFKISNSELNVLIEATVKQFYDHWDDVPEVKE